MDAPLLSQEELALDHKSRAERVKFLRTSKRRTPRFLYRFSGRNALGVAPTLLDSTLWLSSPAKFNDPFDVRACLSLDAWSAQDRRKYVTDGLKAQGIQRSRRDALASDMLSDNRLVTHLQKAFETNVAETGVCCFAGDCRSARSTLMWSHYAKDHTGLCFQYRTSDCPSVFYRAREVAYTKDVIRIGWIDRTARISELVTALHSKSVHWDYEKEHRIVFPGAAGRALACDPRALTGVVLGCKAPPEAEDKVVELCRQRGAKGYPAVRLLRATMSPCSYGVSIRLARDLEKRVLS